MDYQHLKKSKEMAGESGVEKRPKCVSFAFWWFVAWGVIGIVADVKTYLYLSLTPNKYQAPWTEHASICILCILMLCCARLISNRNMAAVFMAALTLFFSAWIRTSEIAVAIGFALFPMIFLVLPHSIRWLKLNNRFSVSALVVSVLMVISVGVLRFMPNISDTAISNVNPLLVVLPGDKVLHKVNKDYQHVYDCRQHGFPAGRFVAQYNQNGECCYVRWDGSDQTFWGNVVDFCNERFDNRISWSDAVSVKESSVISLI